MIHTLFINQPLLNTLILLCIAAVSLVIIIRYLLPIGLVICAVIMMGVITSALWITSLLFNNN